MLFGAVSVAVLSLLTILFASPLFAVLGFEYSALMALALSLICGLVALRECSQHSSFSHLKRTILESLVLSAIPLALSILSLTFLPNCAFLDGLVFYLEIAVPSALLGGLFGLSSRWLTKRLRTASILFITFWAISLFFSLLPGYYNPQIYTYGWQYGFFPGITWDESLELTNAYLAFRIENIIWAVFALSLAYEIQLPRRPKMWFVIPGVIALTLFAFNDSFRITTSHEELQTELRDTLQPVPNCTIYYSQGSLTDDERSKLDQNVRWYVYDIEDRFQLSPHHEPITIYIYPTTDNMFDLIGTRTASLSKPWLSEVHIAKENLESLKHELTHVLMREKGVFPFYVSWSTGVTEGVAMSVEPEYDGIYTLDEHAARILQLHYASGVKEIMSFSGFAANASQKSYVLAGSFSRYLLKTYGPAPFDRVYSSLNWKKEYGKPLDSLEVEWKRSLQPLMTQMDPGDSAHFNYYYNRSSIIYDPCLRRIGKLEREGSDAFHKYDFASAFGYYHEAIEEGAGISALFDEERALLSMNNWRAALRVLDTTCTPAIRKQRAALDLQRADLHVISNDTVEADSLYSNAQAIKLNWQRFLYSYAGAILMCSDSTIWKNYLTNAFTNKNWNPKLNDEWLQSMSRRYSSIHNEFRSLFAIRIFRLDNFIRSGKLSEAKDSDFSIFPTPADLTTNDSLALSIYLHLRGEYGFGTDGEELCPQKYSRAAQEMAEEINAEERFLRQHPAAPGRGRNP